MKLLAIESSTECCSVALRVGEQVLARQAVEARGHATLILPWARELLAEAGLGFAALDGLVCGRGPGGFTSLRIGLGIVQGLALAHELPIHPVSSLNALADNLARGSDARQLLALLDARMGEVYGAWYRRGPAGLERIGDEFLSAPDALSTPGDGIWTAGGPGAFAYWPTLVERLGPALADQAIEGWPDAPALLRLADRVAPVAAYELEPVYLRDQVTG